MPQTRTNLIVAVAENGVIGRDGDLPWRIPADLKRFKKITMGHPLVMGRKTFESLPNGPLPGRLNVVITRQKEYKQHPLIDDSCLVCCSLDEARLALDDKPELMIIGGASIYAEALSEAKRIFLTEVHARVPGDVSFPKFNRDAWTQTFTQSFPATVDAEYSHSFVVLERA